jgi:hypothetical protein
LFFHKIFSGNKKSELLWIFCLEKYKTECFRIAISKISIYDSFAKQLS